MNRAAAHIVLLEDEPDIAAVLGDYLRQADFEVAHFSEGGDALIAHVKQHAASVVLLDIMVPGRDGLAMCREIRSFSAVPIIMVTARVEEMDKLLALDIGADDYVCKPFSPREVVARVKAQLRRAGFAQQPPAEAALFSIDKAAQRIKIRGEALDLTAVEYRLLSVLVSHPGVIFSRAQLLEKIHSDEAEIFDRVIDTHVKNLRRKIAAKLPEQACLHSVYGAGYRFEL